MTPTPSPPVRRSTASARYVAAAAIGIATLVGSAAIVPAQAVPEATDAGGWSVLRSAGISTCGIRTNGTLWCWGGDAFGQVGDGDESGADKSLPLQVGRRHDWVKLSAGALHMCAVRSDHSLWCWGDNAHGALGDGTTTVRRTPVQVASGVQWASVSAGENDTCAVTTDGVGWCWGWGLYGELGNGTHGEGSQSAVPVLISGDYRWNDFGVGRFHTCGTQVDGSLWCWGDGAFGQLGNGTFGTGVLSDVPLQVGSAHDWATLEAGNGRTFAFKSDSTLWAWGDNSFGALGVAPGSRHRLRPTQVAPGTTWRDVSGGSIHTCAVSSDDGLWCWGDNQYGELGDGTYQQRDVPQRIAVGTSWSGVSAGYYHGCAIRLGGKGWCWGVNQSGALGDGTFDDSNVPVRIVKDRSAGS